MLMTRMASRLWSARIAIKRCIAFLLKRRRAASAQVFAANNRRRASTVIGAVSASIRASPDRRSTDRNVIYAHAPHYGRHRERARRDSGNDRHAREHRGEVRFLAEGEANV